MGRRSRSSALDIWMNGKHVATWRVSPARGHELTYNEAWTEDPAALPVSLSMPIVPHALYRGEVVANYFENLLPENRSIRERLRDRFHAASVGAFDLLTQIGRDCVGAVQLLPGGTAPEGFDRIECDPLSDSQVARVLREGYGAPLRGMAAQDDESFRISIPGMQEKVSLTRHRGRWCRPRGATPTTHIMKLPMGVAPSGIDLRTSVQNEWLCMQLVAAFGVETHTCTIERFEDLETLVVERFDRRLAARGKWIERVPQEDFCQATGAPPQLKYESDGGPGIARIMRELGGANVVHADRLRFMRMQLVYWLMCAIDGHAKNFSVFLEPGGRFRLTPAYDVLSAYPVLGRTRGKIAPEKVRMSMALWGANRHYRWADIRRAHFVKTAKDCGIGGDIEPLIAELVKLAPRAVEKAQAALPREFPADVAEPIFAGVTSAAKRLIP
jgi:serine/threonine-protein kinase HipA